MIKSAPKIFILAFLLLFFGVRQVFAQPDSFVTIINPVRGSDFWGLKDETPLSAVQIQSAIIKEKNLPATWLLRYDALGDSSLVTFFKTTKEDELGLFLEVTPALARESGVPYHKNELWHWADSVFLSGYKVDERKKLVQTTFERFGKIFGYYPSSVGAWHVDAFSASFMREKYGITAILLCADQFSTDNYQIWGGWWSTPYYPSRLNILMPAQSVQNKLDVVVLQWAARDPVNGYGGGVNESTFSVQANDYLKHNLEISYFEKLLDIYTTPGSDKFAQLTIGLENDNNWKEFSGEFERQILAVAKRVNEQKFKVVLMKDFASWYQKNFPQFSPAHLIDGEDPLGSDKRATWSMSPKARVGTLTSGAQTLLRDLRVYNENLPEANYQTANVYHDLALVNPAEIDSVRFPQQAREVDNIKSLTANLSKSKIPFAPPSALLLLFYSFTLLLCLLLFLRNRWLGVLVFLGTVTQSLIMVKSGLLYPFGMGFWGPNGHDGIWHIALINQLAKFSFDNPIYAGVNLSNYHYFYDLLVALLNRLTTVPVITLYFQIMPVVFSTALGILTYLVVKKWLKLEMAALFSVFFVYFGGGFGWIVTWMRERTLGGESVFWANQSISFLINPPFALSIIVFLVALYFFLDYLKKPSFKLLLILSFLFGILIQIKVYAGVIVLIGLVIVAVYRWRSRSELSVLKLCFGSLAISLVVFLPSNWRAGSLIVLSPLWFPHTMLAFSDRVGWVQLENARQAYLATKNWLRWILAEGLGLFIFLAGNLGTRLLGVILIPTLDAVTIFLLSIGIFGALFSLLFIQKGNPWNTIQFFYYFLFVSGIFAGVAVGRLKNLVPRVFLCPFIVILVILTIPTTIGTLRYNYLPPVPPARVSYEELFALDFLKRQAEGTVLTFPYESGGQEKFSEPRPLYGYETTAYVSAFSSKTTFLEDEMNLDIMGYNWKPRKEEMVRFFATDNTGWAREFLTKNKIRYIYLVKGQKMNLGENDIGAKKIFENGEARVYQVSW